MIAEERDVQIVRPIVEEEAQVNVPAEFKGPLAEFANTQATVKVRLPECFGQLAQGKETFDAPLPRQLGEPAQDLRINDQWLLQSFSSSAEASCG